MTINNVVERCIEKDASFRFSLRSWLFLKRYYCPFISAARCPYSNSERVATMTNSEGISRNYFGCDYSGSNQQEQEESK